MYEEWTPPRKEETPGGEITDRDLVEIQLMARDSNAMGDSVPTGVRDSDVLDPPGEGLDERSTVDVQPPPVLDDVVSSSPSGLMDASLLKEYQEFQEFLAWKRMRETVPDAPKEYIREPQSYHYGYSCTMWERSDFVSSTIIVTAPEPDPENGRGDKHELAISFVTDSNRRIEFAHTFTGTKWETVVEAIGDSIRITIDGHEFYGDIMPHPERTWNARVRGLGGNVLVGAYENGAFQDEQRTRKLGQSIVDGGF